MFTHKPFYDLVRSVAIDDGKFEELAKFKADTILETLQDKEYKTVLSLGFSLVAYGLALKGYEVHIIKCCGDCVDNFDKVDFKYVRGSLEDHANTGQKYDLVLAVDQATTYVDTNYNQQQMVNNLAELTGKTLVTTLRDYKNQKPQERIFDEPFYIKYDGSKERIVLNHRKWDQQDRQAWDHYIYIIDENQEMVSVGPIKRRTMYFKQLAKFLHDNDVQDFTVHKSPMYKSIFSRNFEYIITAEFDE